MLKESKEHIFLIPVFRSVFKLFLLKKLKKKTTTKPTKKPLPTSHLGVKGLCFILSSIATICIFQGEGNIKSSPKFFIYIQTWTILKHTDAYKQVFAYTHTKHVMWKKENKIILLSVLEIKLKLL